MNLYLKNKALPLMGDIARGGERCFSQRLRKNAACRLCSDVLRRIGSVYFLN